MLMRWRLKRSTEQHHELLDNLVSRLGCFNSSAGYAHWLRAMHEFHKTVVRELDSKNLPPTVSLERMEIRAHHLTSDLADLDVPTFSRESRFALPVADGIAALGVLYVTEGATLGAKRLVERAKELGFTERRGARYLASAANDRTSWPLIVEALQNTELSETEADRVIDASRLTFKLAADCLADHHDN